MKVNLVIICAIVIVNTLADSKQLPQLLIYEVSEKNGEPQVRLIKTQNRINLNDFVEKNTKQSRDWYPDDDKNYYFVPNKYRDNLQSNKHNYRSNNRDYKKLLKDIETNIDSNKYTDEIKKLKEMVENSMKESEARDKVISEKEAEMKKRIPMVDRWLQKLEEHLKKKKKPKIRDNGQVYVGTMNLNDADKFLRSLINNSRKPRFDSMLGRSKSVLRTGLDDDFVDERTAPPPPKNVYVPDYYD